MEFLRVIDPNSTALKSLEFLRVINPNSTALESFLISYNVQYSSSYTRFSNLCTLNSLNLANITLIVFMDYLTHLFKNRPPLALPTINGHCSMLNQLLLFGRS
ncbi:hypothetical protein ACTFIR_012772 [Dictyostelium discoideum]